MMIEELTEYFRNINRTFYAGHPDLNDRLLVIGAGLPPELIYSADPEAVWILSGSPEDARECDTVPKDADDLSRSVFGLLSGNAVPKAVVMLISDDNSRKLACELRRSIPVITADMPAMYQSADVCGYWEKSLVRLFEQLNSVIRIRRGNVRGAAAFMNSVRKQVKLLAEESRCHPDAVSFRNVMEIVNSLYYASDRTQWLSKLEQLTAALHQQKLPEQLPSAPSVILAGSPIYYPNHKIPDLLEETDIHLLGCLSPVMQTYFDQEIKMRKNDYTQFYSIIRQSMKNIILSEYLETNYVMQKLEEEISLTKPDGVIFHVIRGRKTEDADAVHYEKLCEKKGISYFKIETDYQKNDIEQLRLRLEAFREILV